MAEMASDKNLVGAVTESENFRETIRVSSEIDEENFERSPGSESSGKYLSDEKFIEEVKAMLSNYVGKNCIKVTRIRVRDVEEKGYGIRVKIQGDEEIKVSEFLNGSFCKDKRISRLSLMTNNGNSGLSCDVNAKGVRRYKVENGPPAVMTVDWYVGEKKCTVEMEIGVNSLKIINLNEVTEEELATNQKIRINGKSFVEAVQSAKDPLQ